jgi:AhpD family alkylhydroperoxidase
MEKGAGALSAMFALSGYVKKSSLEETLVLLLLYRVSQINGCAYCLDMHSKDARAAGESEQRLYLLSAWRDAPLYSERERAALEWAESLTVLQAEGVSDEVYERARAQFTEKELIDLTMAVVTINSYNRMNIAFRIEGGSYQPGQWERAADTTAR